MSIGALPKRFACQRQTVSYDSLHWFKSDELPEAHLQTLQRRTRSDPPLGIAPTICLVCGTVPAATCAARCFAIDHSAAGIDCGVDAVEQDDFAAIRNPTRIDRAMSNSQSHASGALVSPRIRIRTAPAAGPVNGDSGQQ